ncbi:AhpC/TSA family protein [Aquisphaera giovannonii]|uniref:AhpC/TSA family protein n=1 Tax=Aquisphaera giovannonii TaxID=406548 RepID=A0A5B9W7G9_9BACT|nr:redoxin domain-containing protein [Aquisphaera giovannonii]QEH36632.1 AhpC/TSA family protein [Aquisphaera giovannonii]
MPRLRSVWISASLALAGVGVLAYAALKPPSAYHPVTAAMNEAAGTMSGRPATELSALATDGKRHSPAFDARDKPAVLVFIRDGCPCSEAADPYFRRLYAAYGSDAAFLGIMDGDLDTARDWAGRHGTPYPILSDPDRRVIRACQAERSAYVMLVASGGRIEAFWPGYSAAMLRELGTRLARMAGHSEVPLDVEGAPGELGSGCRF